MSGLESLDELAHDVLQAYEEECRLAEAAGISSPQDDDRSIRDVHDEVYANGDAPETITRLDMLESWQNLMTALNHFQVFLQYAPSLEKLFAQANFFDETKWGIAKTLVDLMIECVENNDKGSSADCRYVTLLEILASYGGHWELSTQLELAWEGQAKTVDHTWTAHAFRREAYGVLVSLPWVPKSQGLHQVCGMDNHDNVASEGPDAVLGVFYQIRANPLPRHDCIHRILSRLKEGPNVTVAISASSVDDAYEAPSGRGLGLGKTTLAAMVASHPAVQSKFSVLWLRLHKYHDYGGIGLTYKQYKGCLDALCEQLGVNPEWPKTFLTAEESSLTRKREEENMFQAKREMAFILQNQSKGILLVVDDVVDDQEIEWFWFLEDQSMLVTTTAQDLCVDWTLDLDPLSEAEALELFSTEADYPSNHVLTTTVEARSIMQRCSYHPLTIRTVARWFRLKQVTAGVVKGMEELSHELSACTAKLRHSRRDPGTSPSRLLTEVMNLMLSPVLAAEGQPTMLMKMCLASMAIVFPEKVQLEAVHLLWGHLLRTEPDAINELGDNLNPNQLRKRVRFISEALTSLGLLSIAEKGGVPFVEIYHGLQWEYALMLGREMRFNGSPAKTARRWHEAFASAYLNKKVEADREGGEDVCRIYALENLLQHMLSAGMYQKVAVLLRDDRFLNERLDLLDWTKAADCHIKDCKGLQEAMKGDESINADHLNVAVAIYVKAGGLIFDHAQKARKKSAPAHGAMALQKIAFALMELGQHSEAISQYKAALKLETKGTALAASILYSLSTVYIAKNDHKKGLNNVKECLKVLKEIGESNTLYAEALILKGDSMMTTCDYKGALESYDRALDTLFADSDNCRVEIGIALGRKGRLYQVMGEIENAYGALDECLKWKLKIHESSCDLASIYNFLGDLCMDRGEKKEALDFFDAAYRLFEQHRDEADETDIHIINGKTDYLNSDYSGSQESFKLALEIMEKSKRPLMERTAYDYRTIGRTFLKQRDFGQAKATFDKCLDATNDRRDESLERSAALFDMGNLYVKSKETKSAFPCFEDSLKIRIVKLGPSETVIDAMEKIGSLHKQVGEREDALNYFNKALELTEKVHGEDSPKVAQILFKFGELKEEMDEHVEALAMLGECLDIQRRHLPGRHPEIASTVDALGKIHLEKHNYEKAYQLFIEGLEIRQATFQADDPRVGDSFHNLGVVSRKGGKCERALTFLMEALHVRKSLEDESFTVETLLEIGNVHRALGDPESALGCYEKCLEITLDRYGGEDERISDILLPLGHAKKDLGFADDAVDFYKRALEIREKKCGKDGAKCAAGLRSLGLVMYEKGDYRAAIKYLVDFIRIQDAKKQKNSIDYVVGLEIIGDIHKFNKNAEDAVSAYAAASNAYRQNKELSKLYPALGGFLEKRLAAEEKQQHTDQEQSGGLFGQFLVNLDEEVKTNDTIEDSPEEEAFRRKIIFDG